MEEREPSPPNPPPSSKAWRWAPVGAGLTFLAVVSYFVVFAQFPSLRDRPWFNSILVIGCGLLTLKGVADSFRSGAGLIRRLTAISCGVLALAFASLFFAYIGYLSYQIPGLSETTDSIDTLPDFSSTDQHGQPFGLNELAGKHLLLVFYRGFW